MSTLGLFEASTRLLWIADRARRMPEAALTNLSQFIDVEFIRDAYRRTRKDGAVGVDGKTAADFEQDLEGNLKRLHELLKSGCWRAPPVRRVHIPKGTGGKTRPIGIPTFEDKVLQRTVAMVLEAVYEQSFMECSYGFRPGRSAHQALDAVWRDLTEMKGGWVVDVDIKGFFDSTCSGSPTTGGVRVVSGGSSVRRRPRAGSIGLFYNSPSGVGRTGTVPWPSSTAR